MSLKLYICASPTPKAQAALLELTTRYPNVPIEDADVVVALGGDGFMIEQLHACIVHGKPVYGMNRGSTGFLLNHYSPDDLVERVQAALPCQVHPLRMEVETLRGIHHVGHGVNEVSLVRETRQAAKIRVKVNGVLRVEELMGDGVLVATPAGSSAYNFSANGPILPLNSKLLALTPINPFRPRRWKGALLPHDSVFEFEVLSADVRKVSATCDFLEIRDVTKVRVWEDATVAMHLLFDPETNLEERILAEQFNT